MVMDGDVSVVESAAKNDFSYSKMTYPPRRWIVCCTTAISCGWRAPIVGTRRPSHARCTPWTMKVKEAHDLNVVIVGSWNVNPGFRLVERAAQPDSYPGIAADYEHTFMVLKSCRATFFSRSRPVFRHAGESSGAQRDARKDVWSTAGLPQGRRGERSRRSTTKKTAGRKLINYALQKAGR